MFLLEKRERTKEALFLDTNNSWTPHKCGGVTSQTNGIKSVYYVCVYEWEESDWEKNHWIEDRRQKVEGKNGKGYP